MPHITQKELSGLKELLAKVSPGPWISYVEGRDHSSGESFIMTGPESNRGEDIYLSGASDTDQDFIAAARQEIPRLIAEIERLQILVHGKQTAAE
ncbi:MAG TPA: hypothetical protein VFV70_05075 [Hyphomonadaceae bacterium]|nr:hypothetical protein [Hyphomonadaceae bacterium]